MTETPSPADNSLAAEKVRSFPQTPGVYLMKDDAGRVIYVGKAKNLRARAGSYFLKAAAEDPRTAKLVLEIRDIDYLDAESEIDALLMEARLIKDILPKFNRDLRDDKTFPYLEIFTHEDFPRVRFTREPKSRGTKLYGPFANPRGLRGAIQVLQKIFKFRTCTLDIDDERQALALVSPLPAAFDRPMHGPLQFAHLEGGISQGHPPAAAISRRRQEHAARPRLREEMAAAAKELHFEEAARLRDEIEMLESLDDRGELETHVQPEVFPIDPEARAGRLAKGAAPGRAAADDRGHRHRPHGRHRDRGLGGAVHRRAAVQAGLPADEDSRRRRARRRGQHPRGGRPAVPAHSTGRRNAARHPADRRRPGATQRGAGGLASLGISSGSTAGCQQCRTAGCLSTLQAGGPRPMVISLAKREELVFTPDADEPLHLSRHSYALRLLQYVRDEAHRFAQHYHHLLRRKSQLGE